MYSVVLYYKNTVTQVPHETWEEEGTSSWGCSVAGAASVHFLGGLGSYPPGKFAKIDTRRLNFVAI